MTENDMMEILLFMDATKRRTVIEEASKSYLTDLSNIAADIYDSCIEDYYAQYIPVKYGRHGDITGFNLYSANDISFDEDTYNMSLDFDPNKLLKYYDGKKGREKRDKVLKSVMSGLRGTMSKKTPPGWPQSWRTTYPNQYSQYNLWKSSGTTMFAIYREFMNNVMNDTSDLWYSYIQKLL